LSHSALSWPNPSSAHPRPSRPRRDLVSPVPYRDQNGNDWADIIDMLTMHPEARRQVVLLLAEIEAPEG